MPEIFYAKFWQNSVAWISVISMKFRVWWNSKARNSAETEFRCHLIPATEFRRRNFVPTCDEIPTEFRWTPSVKDLQNQVKIHYVYRD